MFSPPRQHCITLCITKKQRKPNPSYRKAELFLNFQGYTFAMTERSIELLQKALSLTEEERADLAASLLIVWTRPRIRTPKPCGKKKSPAARPLWIPANQKLSRGRKSNPESPLLSSTATKSVEFHEDAERDYLAAIEWYSSRNEVVSLRFAQQVTRAVLLIAEAPQRWPRYSRDSRRFVLRRFPFLVVYRELADVNRFWRSPTPTVARVIGRTVAEFTRTRKFVAGMDA
jgi:toxin ParE1/3/4